MNEKYFKWIEIRAVVKNGVAVIYGLVLGWFTEL